MLTSISEGGIPTSEQVEDYLRIAERTIYRLWAANKTPAVKAGDVAVLAYKYRNLG
jgi:hypothetical protein